MELEKYKYHRGSPKVMTLQPGGGGGVLLIFVIYICAARLYDAPVFDDFSLAGHIKNGHLLSICPTNSQASQIIIHQ